MTKIKICGLQSIEHALAAADAGADFIGFVFVPGVRRHIMKEKAREIIETYKRIKTGLHNISIVGLFANQSLDEVNRIVKECGLDFVQLCGNESVSYCRGVESKVIKQIKVENRIRKEDILPVLFKHVEQVLSHKSIPLLDRLEDGHLGGTGKAFDWSIAGEISKSFDIVLAGGLSPENVDRALIEANPWGVDVSSGVETKGDKDTDKILDFTKAVLQSDQLRSQRNQERN